MEVNPEVTVRGEVLPRSLLTIAHPRGKRGLPEIVRWIQGETMGALGVAAPGMKPERANGNVVDFPPRAHKPDGGFRFISVVQLVMAYSAYREGNIRFQDLRVYLAAHEAHSRRCGAKDGQNAPTYKLEELRRLTGARHVVSVRHSLKRLETVGLLQWGSGGVRFASAPDELALPDLAPIEAMLDAIKNNRRKVPVPRRTLRMLAGGARRAVVATALGHLLRCVYYRSGECSMEGACKTSWVSRTFGLDVRKVKEARAHLRAIGWLAVKEVPQWYSNRFGARVVVSASWKQDCSVFSTTESAPPGAIPTGESAPLETNQNPLREEFKNQKPAQAADRKALVSSKSGGGETLPKPTLRDVRLEDLRNGERLLLLFEEAEARGLVDRTENERLQFFAAAEHAAVIGSINPPGLFARLVRNGWWHFATLSDEDAARARLKKLLFGTREAERRNVFEFSNEDEPEECVS